MRAPVAALLAFATSLAVFGCGEDAPRVKHASDPVMRKEPMQALVVLIANEVLAYLDAGRQQRHEIVRSWEHEFSRHRASRRS